MCLCRNISSMFQTTSFHTNLGISTNFYAYVTNQSSIFTFDLWKKIFEIKESLDFNVIVVILDLVKIVDASTSSPCLKSLKFFKILLEWEFLMIIIHFGTVGVEKLCDHIGCATGYLDLNSLKTLYSDILTEFSYVVDVFFLGSFAFCRKLM